MNLWQRRKLQLMLEHRPKLCLKMQVKMLRWLIYLQRQRNHSWGMMQLSQRKAIILCLQVQWFVGVEGDGDVDVDVEGDVDVDRDVDGDVDGLLSMLWLEVHGRWTQMMTQEWKRPGLLRILANSQEGKAIRMFLSPDAVMQGRTKQQMSLNLLLNGKQQVWHLVKTCTIIQRVGMSLTLLYRRRVMMRMTRHFLQHLLMSRKRSPGNLSPQSSIGLILETTTFRKLKGHHCKLVILCFPVTTLQDQM
mmetsp:Transcript_1652/g.2261  ORF Transcript_1652/g.2261 Transcript_1652/m.2261 type:complete len:248 (-) Transcript_1652:166-909(-)